MTTTSRPGAFHIMAKPTGAICNLSCQYCFFLKKDRLYPGSRFRMSDEVLESYIRQTIEAHEVPEVTVAWQGGEPSRTPCRRTVYSWTRNGAGSSGRTTSSSASASMVQGKCTTLTGETKAAGRSSTV